MLQDKQTQIDDLQRTVAALSALVLPAPPTTPPTVPPPRSPLVGFSTDANLDLTTSLYTYLSFDSDASGTVYTSSTGSNDATTFGGMSIDANGILGSALSLTGSTAACLNNLAIDSSVPAYTVSLWLKTSTVYDNNIHSAVSRPRPLRGGPPAILSSPSEWSHNPCLSAEMPSRLPERRGRAECILYEHQRHPT